MTDKNVAFGTLVLAGTPIGDSTYASQALRDAISSATIIAAEDTRQFLTLCRRIGVCPPERVISYFEGNEEARTPQLLTELEAGATVILATDAGMPSVSDPGYRLVAACISAGVRVTSVPGPSAVLTALAVSGLPVDRFCFEGFLPRKSSQRRSRLAGLASEERTMVFFESPRRLGEFLGDAVLAFGEDRRGAICRELTKPFEEVIRGPLSELMTWASSEVRGEITVVIEGASPGLADVNDLVARVEQLVASGQKRSAAIAEVAHGSGTSKRDLYSAVMAAKG